MIFIYNINTMKELIHLSLERVILNFKSVFSSIYLVFLIFLIPTLICTSTLILSPVIYSFGFIMTSTIMLSSFIIYGTVAGSFRRSTLNKNSDLTVSVRWVDNASTILTMIIMSIIMLFFVLFVLSIFNLTGWMMLTFEDKSSDRDFSVWLDLAISSVVYQVLLITIITYSLSYFIQGFFDSDMIFFTVAISMLILTLLFGAVLNSYFHIADNPGEVDPRFMIDGNAILFGKYSTMPEWFFYPSLLFPYYSCAEILKLNMYTSVTVESTKNVSLIVWSLTSYNEPWTYTLLWIIPYVNIALWWTAGFAYKSNIKK